MGPPDEFAVRFIDELRRFIKTFGLSRRENEECLRVLALQGSKGDECVRFFRRHDASRDYDRRTATALDLACKPIRQWSGRGRLEVVFQISTDSHAMRGRTQGTDAVGILFALHKECAGI